MIPAAIKPQDAVWHSFFCAGAVLATQELDFVAFFVLMDTGSLAGKLSSRASSKASSFFALVFISGLGAGLPMNSSPMPGLACLVGKGVFFLPNAVSFFFMVRLLATIGLLEVSKQYAQLSSSSRGTPLACLSALAHNFIVAKSNQPMRCFYENDETNRG